MGETKTALVTGAGRRLGKAIALRLAKDGFNVAVHYCGSRDGAERTASEVRQRGPRGQTFQADLYRREACATLIEDVLDHFGALDLLVLSAANYDAVGIDDVTEREWDRALDLNLSAPFFLSLAAVDSLRARKGNIVFITGMGATRPKRGFLPYMVSKGATRQLMRTLALELAPTVRVNAVAPGTVLPPDDLSDDEVAGLVADIPLRRVGSAKAIADAVAHLSQADFVTGHELVVDGGVTI